MGASHACTAMVSNPLFDSSGRPILCAVVACTQRCRSAFHNDRTAGLAITCHRWRPERSKPGRPVCQKPSTALPFPPLSCTRASRYPAGKLKGKRTPDGLRTPHIFVPIPPLTRQISWMQDGPDRVVSSCDESPACWQFVVLVRQVTQVRLLSMTASEPASGRCVLAYRSWSGGRV